MTARLQTLPVAAGTWSVSGSRTRIGFTVANFGRPVHGSVACRWGELTVDAGGNPVRARAELDLDSLDTGIAKRDSDLRRPRLLDIDRHPVMTWSADRFTRDDEGGWTAHGELSVRGVLAPLAMTGSPKPDGGSYGSARPVSWTGRRWGSGFRGSSSAGWSPSRSTPA